MSMSSLATVPERVAAADQLVRALDECFLSGFARLGPDQRETLASVGRTFANTPLAGPVGEAVAAMTGGGGVATEPHMVALAAAREALGGARHDALLAQAVEALDGAVAAPDTGGAGDTAAAPTADADPAVANLMTSVRHWLHELALAGLAQLDVQTIAPFAATLEAVQAQPALGRLAALLTGFVDELMENAPTAAMDQVPARRWVDLWSRAILVARALPAAPAGREVSGELRVLGADIRHHDHVATLIAYGTLRSSASEPVRMVRVAISCWKVDAVGGDEVWTIFEAAAKELLTALADHKKLAVSRMQLLPTGDLVWTGTAKPGGKFDPIDAAIEALAPGAGCAIPTPAALDRHPVQLAVPVAIAEATFGNADGAPCVEIDGAKLPLSPTSPFAGVEFTSLRKTKQLFGLLRHDGARWAFQPLVGKSGSKYVGPGEAIARGRKLRGGTMNTLQERASMLLRK